MLTYATIHDPLHLVRAWRDLSELASFGRERTLEGENDQLLGLWLEAPSPASPLRLAASRYAARQAADASAGPVALGSVGVSGLWTLSWLDDEWTRETLLDALVQHARPGRYGVPRGQFVPVFPSSLPPEAVEDALTQLRRRHPRHVSPPITQLTGSGGLVLPTTHDAGRCAVGVSA